MEGFFDFACREDIPDLQEMWRRCFDTEDVYSNFYFERRFVPEDTLIWRIGGKAVSMMTLMDVAIGNEKGSYIYAVATLPEYQRRGIYRELDRWADDEIRRRGGCFSCLVPASPGLFSMYRKLGYDTAFLIEQEIVKGRGKKFYQFFPCAFEEFFRLREGYLKTLVNPVRHPERELRYIYEELRRFSGDVLLYEEGGKTYYAAFTCAENGIYLRECSGSAPERVARSLMACYGKKAVKVHRPAREKILKAVPYGMGKCLQGGVSPLSEHLGSTGYMALMLD